MTGKGPGNHTPAGSLLPSPGVGSGDSANLSPGPTPQVLPTPGPVGAQLASPDPSGQRPVVAPGGKRRTFLCSSPLVRNRGSRAAWNYKGKKAAHWRGQKPSPLPSLEKPTTPGRPEPERNADAKPQAATGGKTEQCIHSVTQGTEEGTEEAGCGLRSPGGGASAEFLGCLVAPKPRGHPRIVAPHPKSGARAARPGRRRVSRHSAQESATARGPSSSRWKPATSAQLCSSRGDAKLLSLNCIRFRSGRIFQKVEKATSSSPVPIWRT